MARYKVVDLSPKFLVVDLKKQLLPGSFAHAVHHLLEHDFDLSSFDTRYRNDATGASAYPHLLRWHDRCSPPCSDCGARSFAQAPRFQCDPCPRTRSLSNQKFPDQQSVLRFGQRLSLIRLALPSGSR